MVICLGRGADLRMAQLMPHHSLSLTPVNPDWFYLPGFTFLVPADPGSTGQSPGGHKMIVVVVLVVCLAFLLVCFFLSTSDQIGRVECLQNDLFCVKWDI